EILETEPTPHIPDYVSRRLAGKYRDRPIISDPKSGDIAPTCVAHYAKDLSTRLVADARFPRGVRPYTVCEYARLQGVPDTFSFVGSTNDAYRMIGNGVSVPVGKWIGVRLRGTSVIEWFKINHNAESVREFQPRVALWQPWELVAGLCLTQP